MRKFSVLLRDLAPDVMIIFMIGDKSSEAPVCTEETREKIGDSFVFLHSVTVGLIDYAAELRKSS